MMIVHQYQTLDSFCYLSRRFGELLGVSTQCLLKQQGGMPKFFERDLRGFLFALTNQ
jgi:hypothetical protein